MAGPREQPSTGSPRRGLGADAWAAVLAAAVLAVPSPRAWVCALAEVADRAVDEAVRAGVLIGTGTLSLDPDAPAESLLQDVDVASRSQLHRRAADVLRKADAPPQVIARHLLEIEPAGDPDVATVLCEAAGALMATGDPAMAARCLDRALHEPAPQALRGGLFLQLAAAELHLGDHPAAADHYAEGFRLTADPLTRALNLREYVAALAGARRVNEATAMLEDAIARFATEAPDLALAAESLLLSFAWFDETRLPWIRQRLRRYPHPIPGHTVGERMLLATETLIDAHHGRRSAADLAEDAIRALDQGRLMLDTGGAYPPFFYAVGVLMLADRGVLARQELDGAIGSAQRRGAADAYAFGCGWMAVALARDGRLADAENFAQRCIDAATPQVFAMSPATLGWVLHTLIERGRYADAERLLGDTGMDAVEDPLNRTFDPVAFARARLRARRGDLDDLAAVAARIRRGSRWNTLDTFQPLVLFEPRLVGPHPRARTEAEAMVRDAELWGTPRALGVALRAQALLEDDDRRITLLERSAAVLATSPARLERARALVDLGAALRQSGSPVAARSPLADGLALADECGAEPLVALARRELRAAGARTRRTRTHGAESLTATEARVAGLARDGLTNPQIAATLVVSPKTVETHLTSAYRKLGIRTRDQLGAVLAPPDPDE